MLTGKLLSVKKQFDDVLGIAEVRAAQGVVQEAEDEFMKSRRSVQETRTELSQLQSQLRELRSKLDRIPREDERYLQLATEEHKVLVEERKLKTDLEGFVALERDNFAALSAAVRNAHERERSRAERTKYWSIIGSACGAVLGILGSTVLNIRRMKEIKLTVQENNQTSMAKIVDELKRVLQFEQLGLTSTDDTRTDGLQSRESRKTLSEILAKLEELSERDLDRAGSVKNLASDIQQLKHDLSSKWNLEREPLSNSENSSAFLALERNLRDVSWWTKVSVAASLSSVSCSLLLYMFYT